MLEKIFVLIPAFNAGGTLEELFARIPAPARSRISRYIVVNDGSIDNTEAVLDGMRENYPDLVRLRHPSHLGYGAAEKTLMGCALRLGVEAAVLLPSDGRFPPELIPKLLEGYDDRTADIVRGSRMLESEALRNAIPRHKLAAWRMLARMENRALGMELTDYHCDYTVYSRKALESIDFNKLSDSSDFDMEMLAVAKAKGLRIKEVAIPVLYADEFARVNPFVCGLRAIRAIHAIRRGKYRDR